MVKRAPTAAEVARGEQKREALADKMWTMLVVPLIDAARERPSELARAHERKGIEAFDVAKAAAELLPAVPEDPDDPEAWLPSMGVWADFIESIDALTRPMPNANRSH